MTGIPNLIARFALSALLGAALAGGAPPLAGAAETISEQDAHAIGVAAYLYFYSPVTMDLTRKQLTNVAKAEAVHAPMNTFANVPTFPPADMKVVVRPNFDTLYSSAWLDMTKEPMIVSVPDTHGRYYLLPMLDMWTDVFASPGWRTTGTQTGNFAVVPPGWSGPLPAGVVRIDAPTPYVWIIGRTKTDGPADYDAVHAIQAGFKITPISQWGKAAEPVVGTVDPGVDMKTPPKITVDTMPAGKFFAYAAEILKLQPPHITDQPILAQMQRIGIERGKSFDIDKVDPAIKAGLETAPQDAQKLMAWKVASVARIANGWSMNTDTMGVYGNYYLKRAIVTQLGLGANLPEDRSIRSISRTTQENRWMAAMPISSISRRVPRRPWTPSGRSHCMTVRAIRWRTASTGSPSAVGCRSNTARTAPWTSISRMLALALTRRRTGYLRRRGRSTSRCGSTRRKAML
jgi:hypothetical protein